MKVTIEESGESKDFGDSPTIKFQAFTPREIFRLGVVLMELVDAQAQVVHSETPDGKGMFLRLPLVYEGKRPTHPGQ